ncbi:MAG: phosphotransferase family protein [Acidimicrobiales bacterium]
MPRPAIPTDVSDLTAEWWTSVLRPHAPGVEVTSADVADAHSGTTGRVVVRLSYAGDPGPLPGTLFCKLAPFDAGQRRLLRHWGIGVMEARFYGLLAEDVAVRVPRVWHAEWDDHGSFVMVLEDLAASGCAFRTVDGPDPVGRALSTVSELARLHAPFWESERFAGDLSWVPDRAGFGEGGGRDADSLAAAAHFARLPVEMFGDSMPPAFTDVGTLYADRVADVLDLFDEGERTLVHGDPHAGNLFDDGGRAGFFDWAMFSHSPGLRDVAYFCACSVPTEVRRAEEGRFLGRYLEDLAAGGVDIDPAEADRQFRLFAVFAWVSMSSTAAMGSRWQTTEYAMAAMERATAAVDDLGSVDLLRDLLD